MLKHEYHTQSEKSKRLDLRIQNKILFNKLAKMKKYEFFPVTMKNEDVIHKKI